MYHNPKEAKFQNNIKFKKTFAHRLFNIFLALLDTKHEVAHLETSASDPEKGDEMSFIWLNQWQKHYFLFKEAGEQNGGHFT